MFGGSYPRQAIEAVTDTRPSALDEILISLVRKEGPHVRADKPLSPRTRALRLHAVAHPLCRLRHVGTYPAKGQAPPHRCAPADCLPRRGAEVAEVIAAHLHDAYKAAGDDPDAGGFGKAKDAYVQAAEELLWVGAPGFRRGRLPHCRRAELGRSRTGRPVCGGGAHGLVHRLRRAGSWSLRAALYAAHKQAGRIIDAARVTAGLAGSVNVLGHGEQAIVLLREALLPPSIRTLPPPEIAAVPATATATRSSSPGTSPRPLNRSSRRSRLRNNTNSSSRSRMASTPWGSSCRTWGEPPRPSSSYGGGCRHRQATRTDSCRDAIRSLDSRTLHGA